MPLMLVFSISASVPAVSVPEEHSDVSQGVPRQVRPAQQRAVRPLRPLRRPGLRQGEANLELGRASLVLFFPPGSPSSGVDDVMVPCKAVARGDNSTCGRPVTFKTGRGLAHLRKDARSRASPFSLISLARFILSTLRSRRQRSEK